MGSKPSMLDGVRVADMTSVIYGPYCTQMLADMGADVIKVEPPSGDNGRRLGRHAKTPGMGALHMTINRGKRSVNWDLKSEEGRAKLKCLIASSDVFIHNVRVDAIRRLGFDYHSVRAFAPEIVYVHCAGFDSGGPDAALPAYDDVIQGASGIASLLSRVDGRPEPRYMPMAVADKVAGLYALQATLAALVHKLRFGEGQHVEVPMFEAVTAFTLLEHLGGGTFPDRGKMGYSRQVTAARQPCPTSDGYICLTPDMDDRWMRFFRVVGRPEVMEDPRLNTTELRGRNRNLLYSIVAEITPGKSTQEWLELMRAADIPAKQVNTLEHLVDDPQLRAVHFFQERVHPTEGLYREVRPAVKYGARQHSVIGFAPLLGEHNAELDAELGFGPGANTVPADSRTTLRDPSEEHR
jgi:crotonobetainyl-CoA:carnitine CoA-transferase CaiB-like acyl-CoA transferase